MRILITKGKKVPCMGLNAELLSFRLDGTNLLQAKSALQKEKNTENWNELDYLVF